MQLHRSRSLRHANRPIGYEPAAQRGSTRGTYLLESIHAQGATLLYRVARRLTLRFVRTLNNCFFLSAGREPLNEARAMEIV